MNILIFISVLFSSVICKTIPHADAIKVISDGKIEYKTHKSDRIIVETQYSNDAPENLQKYIRKRYVIETVIDPDITTIIISKPKTKLIYHGREIQENMSSIIYLPENTFIE